ncbi:hypothetical protein [Nocardioides sp.]|uniref:hypothetical protein n=1 Tax=Nocardioides sp. TaxID=35761 RepID=UPI0031FEEB21|nr:hypothetical protein [Nocardioides sp.]
MLLGDLFTPAPQRWGLRGDVWVWSAMHERLVATPLPDDDKAVERLLLDTFIALVGVDPHDPQEGDGVNVHREEFAHGGMSGGMIHLPWWLETGLPLLASRAEDLRSVSDS